LVSGPAKDHIFLSQNYSIGKSVWWIAEGLASTVILVSRSHGTQGHIFCCTALWVIQLFILSCWQGSQANCCWPKAKKVILDSRPHWTHYHIFLSQTMTGPAGSIYIALTQMHQKHNFQQFLYCCVSADMGTCVLSHYLAMAVSSGSTISAFRHNVSWYICT
jgi:hypothetical protein